MSIDLSDDQPCKEAQLFWGAILTRNMKVAFDCLSSKNKGFILGILQAKGLIDNSKGPALPQFQDSKIQDICQRKFEDIVNTLPLDYAPMTKAQYSPDGLHAICIFLPEKKYRNIVLMQPTQIKEKLLRLHLITELVSVTPDTLNGEIALRLEWRVDWFRLDSRSVREDNCHFKNN